MPTTSISKRFTTLIITGMVLFGTSLACNISSVIEDNSPPVTALPSQPAETAAPAPTPAAPSLLTICMGREPTSLFIYNDASIAARSVRQALYDGPFDTLGYTLQPVLLQEIPTLENGGVQFEPVAVQTSNIIVDGSGNLAKLSAGTEYRPAGCESPACSAVYTGDGTVEMDQMVVRFKLQPGVLWSDGAPLSADDSVYSFEIAQALYPRVRADLINRTQSYLALDDVTVEWRSLPGYRQPGYAANGLFSTAFFSPLPRHAWGSLLPDDLLVSDLANRQPIGWGAYVLEEWRVGDHIALRRNTNYWRAAQGLPHFERLVFRFVPDQQGALDALLAGECDYLDETVPLDPMDSALQALAQAGQINLAVAAGNAWEHLDFGIAPFAARLAAAGQVEAPLPFFSRVETRQAVAMCIDRQRLNAELFQGLSQVPDTYLPAAHPLFNPAVPRYPFDPQAGAALLESVGWLDDDGDPQTPRRAQGVEGVPDGAAFEFHLLTTSESEKQRAAHIIQESLAQCGLSMQIDSRPWQEALAAGPAGPLFGRDFTLAQYAWVTTVEPPCFLYTSTEIPGPYPEYLHGWGGANASGYSSPAFDQACQQAQTALPGTAAYREAHNLAQAIFAQDLPALPLYLRLKAIAARPNLCGVTLDPSAESALWNLENFASGDACP